MNPVISRQYVEKNYIKKDELEKSFKKKLDEIRTNYTNSKNDLERTLAMSCGIFITDIQIEILGGA